MSSKSILKWSFLNALGTLVYIALVVLFMSNGEHWFGKIPEYVAGITMLTLFVFSAATVGALVLGRPLLLYLDGAKADALRLFGYTLAWLFGTLCILLAVVILMA